MNLSTLLLQIILTIPLTIILNYFRNKENRRINTILIPSIYMIVITGLFPYIKENVFLVVIFEIFIRNFYITNVANQEKEISNTTFIIENIVSALLSILIYTYFINEVDSVIPDPETIKPFVWFLIILFGARLYKTATKNHVEKQTIKSEKRKNEQTIIKYARFKNQYGSMINSKNSTINKATYAIMIFLDNKYPKLNRKIKEYKGAITKEETTYGIMQVHSLIKISDEESIRQRIDEYERILKNTKLKEVNQLKKLITDFKPEEQDKIIQIFNEIIEFDRK